MAKQTGQITVLKNNTVTNVEHQIRFIFTKENGERITRDTTSKGVINFDIPNGDWNVSWFAVDGDQKVLPLRAGLQLKITSSTPPTALADWIYGDNTHVADPILAQWTDVLDEMKAVRDQFRDETQSVGGGKFMKEGAGGFMAATPPYAVDERPYYGKTGFTSGSPASWVHVRLRYGTILESHRNNTSYQLGIGHQGHIATRTNDGGNPKKNEWIFTYNEVNTTIGNHGQLHDGTGTPKDLLAVGDFGFGGGAMGISSKIPEVDSSKSSLQFWANFIPTLGGEDSGLDTFSSALVIASGDGFYNATILATNNRGELKSVAKSSAKWQKARKILDDVNTVVDSNGNYKPASPVIQLHYNRVEYNEDFDKDNPPVFEHLETGVYRITNVREICKDGWTFNKPRNGKDQPFFMIKYEQEDATTLLVRVFERTFNSKTGEFGFGEPRDIGVDERWIDFHFEVDHERIAREEAQIQKEQEEFEEQERLRKEAEDLAEAEANARYEAEMAKHEKELLAEMEAEHKEE